MSPLAGLRILLVEDEFLVAAMVEDMLSELGAVVVGPAATISKGLALAETARMDAAVLDVNVGSERVDAIAETLHARGIPFILATGYGEGRLDRAPDVPVVAKPYTKAMLAEALAWALRRQPSGT